MPDIRQLCTPQMIVGLVTGLLLSPVIEPGEFIDVVIEGVQGHTALPFELLHLRETYLG